MMYKSSFYSNCEPLYGYNSKQQLPINVFNIVSPVDSLLYFCETLIQSFYNFYMQQLNSGNVKAVKQCLVKQERC